MGARRPDLLPELRRLRGARHGGPGGGEDAGAAGGIALVRAVSDSGASRQTEPLRDRLFDLRKKGFNRLYQDGQVFEFSTPESLLDIDFSQAGVRAGGPPGDHRRTCASGWWIRSKSAIAKPAKSFSRARPGRRRSSFASTRSFSARCGKEFVEPEPSLFSFNSPFGACKRCQGFGNTIDYDMDLVIPDRSLSLEEGAVDPWTKPQYSWYCADFRKADAGQGAPERAVSANCATNEKALVYEHVRDFFKEVETKKYKVHVRVFLSRYRGYTRCPDCGGSRLRPEALYIRVGGKTMAEVVEA